MPDLKSLSLWWTFRRYIMEARFRYQLNNDGWILGRIACLGQDVLRLTNPRMPIWNVQKGRVDCWIRAENNKKCRPRTALVAQHISREDIIPLIHQQEIASDLPSTSPSIVFIDSYSELTDQLFVHAKDRWEFCANYGDIKHTAEFMDQFEEHGLLPLEQLDSSYRQFFSRLRARHGDVPVVFLHFPTKLDQREKFRCRADAIKTSIERVSKEFSSVYSISIDDAVVDWPELQSGGGAADDFPYHYNSATYREFWRKIREHVQMP